METPLLAYYDNNDDDGNRHIINELCNIVSEVILVNIIPFTVVNSFKFLYAIDSMCFRYSQVLLKCTCCNWIQFLLRDFWNHSNFYENLTMNKINQKFLVFNVQKLGPDTI